MRNIDFTGTKGDKYNFKIGKANLRGQSNSIIKGANQNFKSFDIYNNRNGMQQSNLYNFKDRQAIGSI